MTLRTPDEPVPDYVLCDLRRTYLRIAANEHWYQQEWMGVPTWQLPDDLIRIQNIFWDLSPEIIVETGTKYGGLTLFMASLIAMSNRPASIITVDLDLLPEAAALLASHHLSSRIVEVIEGDATGKEVLEVFSNKRIDTQGSALVILDDDHNSKHVIEELDRYSALLQPGDMIVVFDTVFADLADTPVGKPSEKYPDMAQSNPRIALEDWLTRSPQFTKVTHYHKTGVSNFRGGVLIKDS